MAKKRKYTVRMDTGARFDATSIRDAAKGIREFGSTASSGMVIDAEGREVAWFRRSPEGRGNKWYRAYLGNPKRKAKRKQRYFRISGQTARRLNALLGRKKNVEMGFYDATGFHPIRASKDYSGARAGERRARSYRARGTRLRSATKHGRIRRG